MLYRAEEYRKLELDWSIKSRHIEIRKNIDRMVGKNPDSMSKDEKEQFCMELAGAVRDADTFKISVPNLAEARKMLDKLIGERIPEAVKRKLRQGLETMDKTVLREVLHHCENEGFFSSLVRDCMQLLEKIEDADSALAMAIREMKEEYVRYTCARVLAR